MTVTCCYWFVAEAAHHARTLWRTAARFDASRGTAATWILTIAHRRAIDRVRSVTASAQREQRIAAATVGPDEVADMVEATLDRERVRRCLDGLTELQHESITLACYGGYSHRQVAGLLGVALGTIKTRIRDGLIRMRDCMGGAVVKLLRHDLHILNGAYALDALEGAERDRFEHHLHRCQPCAHEVGGLRETATRLAMAVAVVPPPALRGRVLAALARTRQAPPVIDSQPRTAHRPARVPRLAAAAAAVGIAAAAVLGLAQVRTQDRLDHARAMAAP